MIRHISMFFMKDEKKETKELIIQKLRELENKLPHISGYAVGSDCMERPPGGMPGVPEFGDVVQIIDFETAEDAAAYPKNPGHIKLMEETGEYIEKVTAIDVELQEKEGKENGN